MNTDKKNDKKTKIKVFIIRELVCSLYFFFHILTNKNKVIENVCLLFNDWL